jgi:hypothetical protein
MKLKVCGSHNKN